MASGHVVTVKVGQACNFIVTNRHNFLHYNPSPFVEVYCDGVKVFKTKKKSNTVTPSWQEERAIPYARRELKFVVYDHHNFHGNEYLGSGTVYLANLRVGHPNREVVRIMRDDTMTCELGVTVLLPLDFEPEVVTTPATASCPAANVSTRPRRSVFGQEIVDGRRELPPPFHEAVGMRDPDQRIEFPSVVGVRIAYDGPPAHNKVYTVECQTVVHAATAQLGPPIITWYRAKEGCSLLEEICTGSNPSYKATTDDIGHCLHVRYQPTLADGTEGYAASASTLQKLLTDSATWDFVVAATRLREVRFNCMQKNVDGHLWRERVVCITPADQGIALKEGRKAKIRGHVPQTRIRLIQDDPGGFMLTIPPQSEMEFRTDEPTRDRLAFLLQQMRAAN